MYKAVLFDLDGTLLDTLEDLADSMNAALSGLGFPSHPVSSYKDFVGEGVEFLAYSALPEKHRGEATLAECIKRMRQEYGLRWDCKTKPYSGIPELLTELEKKGVQKAILSNKPDDFTKKVAGKFLQAWSFKAILGSQTAFPKKPDPAAAFSIAESMKFRSAEFLYLGDTKIDMLTAVASGMLPVGALWGFRSREELAASGAKKLIQKPEELLEFFHHAQ
jgi:phosphoglycolate phosphatase